jgi:hypothetical protein
MALQRVKYILDMSRIEDEIKELKLSVMGDTLMTHTIHEEKGDCTSDYVIEMKDDDKPTSCRYLFYGRVIEGKLYIARQQFVAALSFDAPDYYDEFFCTGSEFKFN